MMDLDYLLWLQKIREEAGPVWEEVMNGISLLSTVSIFVILVVYWCFDKRTGRFALLCYGIGQALNQTMKAIFSVQRPWLKDSRIKPSSSAIRSATGYSFPSGHSESAFSAYGALIYRRFAGKRMSWFLALLILMIGFSRNYLGVHTPQDVLAGFLVGFLSVVLVVQWQKKHVDERKTVTAILLIIVGLMVAVIMKEYSGSTEQVLLMKKDAMNAFGFLSGLLPSVILEEKKIGFSTQNLMLKQRFQRLLTGIMLTLPCYLFLNSFFSLFMNELAAEWVQMCILAMISVFFVPYIFHHMERRKKNLN